MSEIHEPRTSAHAIPYENLAPSIWNPLGNALVSAADLLRGEKVVDACAGAGACALPAAQEVGADGRVIAVDLSHSLMECAQDKASLLGLKNVEFVHADILEYTPDEPVDAVLMGMGIFLLRDPFAAMSHIRSYLAPGGRFALSTWARPGVEKLLEPYYLAASRHNPAVSAAPRPNEYVRVEHASDPEETRRDLLAAGYASVETGEINLKISMDEALLWDFVRGTALRKLLSPTDDDINSRIRADFAAEALQNGLLEFAATVDLHVAHVEV
jgi:ubiquinone/menaquinone biosynthesis C-methylase UbiE